MPRIVVLDGYTLTPNGPDEPPSLDRDEVCWDDLAQLGDLEVYPRTRSDELIDRLAGVQVVLINKVPLKTDVIAKLPDLKYIGILGTGTNTVDLPAATDAGIVVTNVPGYSSVSVAQHTIALMLALAANIPGHNQAVHEGRWTACQDFCFTVSPIIELKDKTLGIIGPGAIGGQVARIAHAMGMNIVAHSRSRKDVGVPVTWLEIDDLFAQADVISLNCPLTEQTANVANAARIASMKPGAMLINTSRGGLVDAAALAAALRAGDIAGAALDALDPEPPTADHPLLGAPNCIITPHLAWASVESRLRLMQTATDNVRAFLGNQSSNVVNNA